MKKTKKLRDRLDVLKAQTLLLENKIFRIENPHFEEQDLPNYESETWLEQTVKKYGL